MCAAIRTYVRYDIPNENGETRRTRNENFNTPSPDVEIPDAGQYLWEWFFEVSDGLKRRVTDGVCERVGWHEWASWREETGHIVWPSERAILRAMDKAFCAEMNIELSDFQIRQQEAAQKDKPGKYRKGR